MYTFYTVSSAGLLSDNLFSKLQYTVSHYLHSCTKHHVCCSILYFFYYRKHVIFCFRIVYIICSLPLYFLYITVIYDIENMTFCDNFKSIYETISEFYCFVTLIIQTSDRNSDNYKYLYTCT